MGQSTDGILAFGVDLGEYVEFMVDSDYDWDTFVYEISGLPRYGKPGYDHKNADKWLEEAGVELVQYCSCDSPMHVLAVPGTEIVASRGDAVEIDPKELYVTEAQIEKLKIFWDKYIDVAPSPESDDYEYYDEPPEWTEPKWLLLSNWC